MFFSLLLVFIYVLFVLLILPFTCLLFCYVVVVVYKRIMYSHFIIGIVYSLLVLFEDCLLNMLSVKLRVSCKLN